MFCLNFKFMMEKTPKGDLTSEKTEKLIENYAKLLNEGISSSEILVLVQNSAKKNEFVQKTLDNLEVDILEKMQVYSFFYFHKHTPSHLTGCRFINNFI